MNTFIIIKKKIKPDKMLEWFSTVLCWKHIGIVDSATITHAYLWLTSTFGDFAASASCGSFSMA